MTNAYKLFTAATLIAAMVAPVSAQELPLNNTVSGGQGDVELDGQGIGLTAASFGLTGTLVPMYVLAGTLFLGVVAEDGTHVVVSTSYTQ